MDSLVVGEQQIIGQVRSALASAQEAGTAARRLNGVTQAALRCAKRIHTQTGIDRHGASVVSVALDAAAEHLPCPWQEVRAVIVGAGAMASLTLTSLAAHPVAEVTVVNRTAERAEAVATAAGAGFAGLAALPGLAAEADLVVTCTGSTDLVLRADDLRAVRASGTRPLIVLDLAMPHDTDLGLADLPGVTRIALTDLAQRPSSAEEDELAAARRILSEELADYLSDEARRRVDPLVVSLRARAGEHVAAEADRIRARLPHLPTEDLAEIENALRRAVNALLHTPTVRVKQSAADPDGRRLATALHALFDLPASAVESLGVPEGLEDEGWW
jgi:glutamyl-tRNA reductase